MNVVEAADSLRERLDAYGRNFHIEFGDISSGLHLASGRSTDKIWDLRVAETMLTVRFERPDGEISINHCATTLDRLVDDVVSTVKANLKSLMEMS